MTENAEHTEDVAVPLWKVVATEHGTGRIRTMWRTEAGTASRTAKGLRAKGQAVEVTKYVAAKVPLGADAKNAAVAVEFGPRARPSSAPPAELARAS